MQIVGWIKRSGSTNKQLNVIYFFEYGHEHVHVHGNKNMCRNIKNLFNFEPPATDEEITASSIQFVRKLSGFQKPSKANEKVFNEAVKQVSAAARDLVDSLVTDAPTKNREEELEKSRLRNAKRFG